MALVEHPDFAQLEAERERIFSRLRVAQAARSHPLQCLPTPPAVPNGRALVPFDAERKPSDERDSWATLNVSPDVAGGVRLQYYVHRYDGPHGSGVILGACLAWESSVWRCEEHHGPERRIGPFDQWVETSDAEE